MKKIKIYAWISSLSGTDEEIIKRINEFKDYGMTGIIFDGKNNLEMYARIGRITKDLELEFHAWLPTLLQNDNIPLTSDCYVVNGKGQSAYDNPPYVPYYKFVCPNRTEVYVYINELFKKIAIIPEVDGIQLDYIRFPDIILPFGLWEKYGIVMENERLEFDYCYCNKCVADFLKKTGINIKKVDNPTAIKEWKHFRYELITDLVNKLSKTVHSINKKISVAVFPGHSLAKKLVRQDWSKWEVDAIYSMNYNNFYLQNTSWIGEMCKEAVQKVRKDIPIYSGLFIGPIKNAKFTVSDPEFGGLTPIELKFAIDKSVENGAAGICLFSIDRMTDSHWVSLKSDFSGN